MCRQLFPAVFHSAVFAVLFTVSVVFGTPVSGTQRQVDAVYGPEPPPHSHYSHSLPEDVPSPHWAPQAATTVLPDVLRRCAALPARWYVASTAAVRQDVAGEFRDVCAWDGADGRVVGAVDALPEEAQWDGSLDAAVSLTAAVLDIMGRGGGDGAAYVDALWRSGTHASVQRVTDASVQRPLDRVRLRAASLFSRCTYGVHVPRLVHMIAMGNPQHDLPEFTLLAVGAALQRVRPHRVLLHVMGPLRGPVWDAVTRLVTVVWHRPPLRFSAGGDSSPDFDLLAHFADAWRLELLHRHGGVYLDWDVMPTRSFDALFCRSSPWSMRAVRGTRRAEPPGHPLRDPPVRAVPSTAGSDGAWFDDVAPDVVCDGDSKSTRCAPPTVLSMEKVIPKFKVVSSLAALVAPPQAPFLARFTQDAVRSFTPDCYTCHNSLHQLTEAYPAYAVRLGWRAFQYPGWEQGPLEALFDTLPPGTSCRRRRGSTRFVGCASLVVVVRLIGASYPPPTPLQHSFAVHLFRSHAHFQHIKRRWGARLFDLRRRTPFLCLFKDALGLLHAAIAE